MPDITIFIKKSLHRQTILVGSEKRGDYAVADLVSNSVVSQLPQDLKDDINILIKKYNLTDTQIGSLFNRKIGFVFEKKSDEIPLCIFDNDKLSSLEAIVKYLKEDVGLRLKKIAKILNRRQKTIWSTYDNAKKKMAGHFILKESPYFIPTTIFQNRAFSVLESIVMHLKGYYGLTYHQIAVLMHRNDRTIWTTYNRTKRK